MSVTCFRMLNVSPCSERQTTEFGPQQDIPTFYGYHQAGLFAPHSLSDYAMTECGTVEILQCCSARPPRLGRDPKMSGVHFGYVMCKIHLAVLGVLQRDAIVGIGVTLLCLKKAARLCR